MARTPPTLDLPFHAHLKFMAQCPSRACKHAREGKWCKGSSPNSRGGA